MILIDTNILIRYSNATDPSHRICTMAIAALQAATKTLCVVPQCYYEFWVVATRPIAKNGLGLSTSEYQSQLTQFKPLFAFLPDRPAIFDEWELLVERYQCFGKVAHDARFVAAMRIHGLSRIVTLNGSDFARFPGLTILDPAYFVAQNGVIP